MPRYFVKVTSGRVFPNVSVSAPWRAVRRIQYLIGSIGTRATTFEAYQEGVNYGTPATGTVTFTSGTGAVGATIAGTLVTVTWATNDKNSIDLLVAAINSNSTVNKLVTAANTTPAGQTTPGICTLTAKSEPTDHALGNLVTLVLSGTGTTVSGATLGAGTGTPGVTATANAYQF